MHPIQRVGLVVPDGCSVPGARRGNRPSRIMNSVDLDVHCLPYEINSNDDLRMGVVSEYQGSRQRRYKGS